MDETISCSGSLAVSIGEGQIEDLSLQVRVLSKLTVFALLFIIIIISSIIVLVLGKLGEKSGRKYIYKRKQNTDFKEEAYSIATLLLQLR